MIEVFINNQPNTVEENSTLLILIEKTHCTHDCYAVALNGNFIPRSHYTKTILQEKDVVHIVTPMQGG